MIGISNVRRSAGVCASVLEPRVKTMGNVESIIWPILGIVILRFDVTCKSSHDLCRLDDVKRDRVVVTQYITQG